MPINRKIRFLTTANDVIHSWWVPDLGWKKDAIPGFINESWARIDRPGTYRGQCTELCGVGHGFMPIVLQALPEADFQHWLDQQHADQVAIAQAGARTWGRDELMGRGQEIFSAICAACHQATGLGIPGVFPALKGSRIATGPLPAHLDIVLNGKPGTAMQAFGQQFSDSDLAAVITYERNAFGNATADLVHPAEVRAARRRPGNATRCGPAEHRGGKTMTTAAPTHKDLHESGPSPGLWRWVTTTNHKDIGTLYLLFALLMFFVGGIMAMLIRAELFQPGLQLMQPEFFNQLVTMHALIMIFGAVMPALVGLANWQIPLMIGAPDMALPRMNNWSFWLLPFAFALLLSTLFMPGGGPACGLDLLPAAGPADRAPAFPFMIFAIHLMGVSSVMGAINIIATIVNLRAPGMRLMRMPLFVWTWLITAFLLIAVMPVLAGVGDHAADGPLFRHQFLQCRRWRGPGDVPACLLVLRPPRGLHHDPAGLRRRSRRSSRPSPQAAVRLRGPWSTRRPPSPFCPLSSGPTTCSPWACRCRASCFSCTQPC